jgi:hypothetical protein
VADCSLPESLAADPQRLAALDLACVLAIDDLQWADLPLARVLAFALRRLVGLPVGDQRALS